MTDGPHDSDAGREECKCPPAEALVAAFRKALRNGVPSEDETTQQVISEHNGPSAPSHEPQMNFGGATQSREAWARETLAAFRKAAENVWGPNRGDGEPSSAGKPGEEANRDGARSPEIPALQEDKEGEGPPDDPPGTEKASGEESEAEDAADALALAFRRAFFRRRVRHKVSEPVDPDRAPSKPAALPPRPDASFLWVTDQPRDRDTTVGVEHLSGERARRADAFLLRGAGAGPCRLLRRIRQHPQPHVFLKPVFWRRADDQTSLVADHVDGGWTPQSSQDDLRALRERATAINRRVRDVVEAEGRMDASAERRVVQFVATRADEFAPHRPEEDGGDLLYPKLTPLLDPKGS